MRHLVLFSVAVAVLSIGCSLRPRYGDVVQAAQGSPSAQSASVKVRIVEPGTQTPIKGARISLGGGRNVVRVVSDERGEVVLPVNAALAKQNPLVVVDLPAGTRGYAFVSTTPALEQESVEMGSPTGHVPPPDGAPSEPVVSPPGLTGVASPGTAPGDEPTETSAPDADDTKLDAGHPTPDGGQWHTDAGFAGHTGSAKAVRR